MDTATFVALGTLIVNGVVIVAGLYFKDKQDARRHDETVATAHKAAVSAAVAADEASAARTEIADKLDTVRTDVNGKMQDALDLAGREGYVRGVLDKKDAAS